MRRRADGANKTPVALKVMRKRHILKENKGACVRGRAESPGPVTRRLARRAIAVHVPGRRVLVPRARALRRGELFDRIQGAKRRREEKTKTKGGGLSLAATRRVASDLLDAVEACHARGVVHRDLKPENVLFDAEGALKLCDFASCPLLNVKGDEDYEGEDALGRRKRQLAFVGTCDYVPPEILGEPGRGRRGRAVGGGPHERSALSFRSGLVGVRVRAVPVSGGVASPVPRGERVRDVRERRKTSRPSGRDGGSRRIVR